jgi:hypothetical protein
MDNISEAEFRQLVEQFKIFNDTMRSGGAFNSGTEKVVAALGVLGTKLDKSERSAKKQDKSLDDFNAAIEKSMKRQEESTKSTKAATDATEADTKSTKAHTTAMDEYQKREQAYHDLRKKITGQDEEYYKANKERLENTRNLSKAMRDHQAASKSSSAEWFDSMKQLSGNGSFLKDKLYDLAGNSNAAQLTLRGLGAAAEGVTKSLTQYSAAIYKGERGAVASANAIESLAKPVLEFGDMIGNIITFASMFVPGGILVKAGVALAGMLIKGASAAGELALKFNKLAAEQSDKLFKTFNDLSKAGVSGVRGMTDVFEGVQTLGMTMDQIDEYNKLLSTNAKTLKMFGATAAQGSKAFAEVAGGLYKSDVGRSLEMLGVTAEEQRDSALEYMSLQARTGQLQLNNTKKLMEGSAEFVKELDLAAQMTGTTRKEQMEAREIAMADDRHRAALIEARNNNDEKEIKRLEKAQKLAGMLKASGDEEGAAGVLQYAAGGAYTKQSQAAMRQYDLDNTLSKESMGEMFDAAANATRDNQKTFAGLNKYIGKIDSMQTSIAKADDFQLRQKALAEGASKAGFTGKNAIEDFLKTEQGQKMYSGDKDTGLMVDANRAQQAAGQKMDAVVKTFNGAAQLHEKAAKAFTNAVDTFSKVVGAKGVTGGDIKVDGVNNESTKSADDMSSMAELSPEDRQSAYAQRRKELENAPLMARWYGIGADKYLKEKNEKEKAASKEAALTNVSSSWNEEAFKKKDATQHAAYTARKEALIKESHAKINDDKSLSKEQKEIKLKSASASATKAAQQEFASVAIEAGAASAISSKTADREVITPEKVLDFGDKSGDREHFAKLDLGLRERVLVAANDYFKKTNKKLKVNSAVRDSEDQQRLWDETVKAGREGIGPTGMLVAKPGTSKHELGNAVDIQQGKGDSDALTALKAAGLKQPFPDKDPVHFEQARTGGIFKGPSSGYLVEMHGEEEVKPVNSTEVTKSPLGTASNDNDKSYDAMMTMFGQMISRLDEVINLLDDGNNYNKKLVNALS